MNIVLSGFKGSGKVNIAKVLSKKLSVPFIDLDEYIQEKCKLTVSQIFEMYTEPKFKQLELEALIEISKKDGCILTTGGGTLLSADNLKILKRFGKIVFLDISIETLMKRLYHLKNGDIKYTNKENAIGQLLMGRLPIYKSAADLCIDANNCDEEKIADLIINKLQKM